jgi:hypothetical protein
VRGAAHRLNPPPTVLRAGDPPGSCHSRGLSDIETRLFALAVDLHGMVKVLKEEGCEVLDRIDESEYGKFAWVIDPEGNKVELWQPPSGQ